MELAATIFIGVLSGVIASVLFFALGRIYQKILVPWFEERIYKGINVEGVWQLEHIDYTHHRRITLELTQHAQKLSGTSIHIATSETATGDRLRRYRINGRIQDRFLLLSGEPSDSSRIGAVTFLLEVVGDGQVMEGFSTAYSTVTSQVIGARCKLTRGSRPDARLLPSNSTHSETPNSLASTKAASTRTV